MLEEVVGMEPAAFFCLQAGLSDRYRVFALFQVETIACIDALICRFLMRALRAGSGTCFVTRV